MNIQLREATIDDLELILAWRNHPEVYKTTYQQGYLGRGLIDWDTHWKWWNSRQGWFIFIIQVAEDDFTRDVGGISLNLNPSCPDIGYYVGEITLWNKGVGTKAISLALDWLKEKGYREVEATVLKTNLPSSHVLAKLGFRLIGDGREGELVYKKILT